MGKMGTRLLTFEGEIRELDLFQGIDAVVRVAFDLEDTTVRALAQRLEDSEPLHFANSYLTINLNK